MGGTFCFTVRFSAHHVKPCATMQIPFILDNNWKQFDFCLEFVGKTVFLYFWEHFGKLLEHVRNILIFVGQLWEFLEN